LIPAQYVKPFLKGHKNDYRDAEAIAEAMQRPTMQFVAIQTPEQIRGFLIERGITVRQGVVPLRKVLRTSALRRAAV
jgi:transposase